MHSKVSGNTGWLVGLGISKHFGAVSALVFSLVLSACGGGSGGDGNTLTAVDGAPSLTSASISADDNATVTVGDVVTVTVTASEAIMAPSVTIGGSAATSVLGSGEDWTASRAMTADDTVGDISFSVSFSDISGESGESVSTSTDSSAVAFEINTQAGNAIDGPFQFAKAFGDYNGNGVHDENEPSSITDADGAYSLIEDTDAPETYTIIVEMTADTIDSVTGESFAGTGVVLKGSSAGAVVTPLTTLLDAAKAADPSYTAEDLAEALGLPEGVHVEQYNPFAADADPATAHAVETVFQQVMTATLIVSEAMMGLGDMAGVELTAEQASAAALQAITSMVVSSTVTVDLSDSTQADSLAAFAVQEMADSGIVMSDAVSNLVLGQATGSVAKISGAFAELSADDFGTTAASAVSLLKHDATEELESMSAAAITFLADPANDDLGSFDASVFVTLNTDSGINSAIADHEGDLGDGAVGGVLDFEDTAQAIYFADIGIAGDDAFPGSNSSAVMDVDDNTNTVIQSVRLASGKAWNSVLFVIGSDIDSPDETFPFAANDSVMSMDIRPGSVGKTVALKFEGPDGAAVITKATTTTSVADQWETLYFDFDAPIEGTSVSVGVEYFKVLVFYDFGGSPTADETFYFDNITYGGVTDPNAGGGSDPVQKNVTFSVDMTGVDLGGEVPTLQSTFNSWCGACNPMSDDDGDNVWTLTVPLDDGEYEYKYAIGNWVSQEDVPSTCENTIGANRKVTVAADMTLATDVYSGCPVDNGAGGSDPVQKNVTFSVDMTGVDLGGEVPTLQSTFNSWCGACNPMSDDDGDNVWTLTVPLDDGEYEYKYAIGNWVSQEDVPSTCENTIGANRKVTVAADMTLATDVYSGCPVDNGAGGSDPVQKNVTFSVDMTGVDLGGEVPTLQSTFNSWCGACNPMSDDDGDNVWTLTVPLDDGEYEYKYAIGNWVSQEDVPSTCENTIGANRKVTVAADMTLATDVYSGCPVDNGAGGADPVQKNVTFSVDMTGVDLGGEVPTLQSTFNSWCGACNPMSDDDGDNVWTLTVPLDDGEYEYKYAIGNWVSQEDVPSTCENTIGANRKVTVAADMTLATDVYSGCPVDNGAGGADPVQKNVTFSVDMTGVDLGGEVPTLQSTFNSWCGACNPMSDDGDNVWTLTVPLDDGEYEYKYAIGNWVSQEDVPSTCENTIGKNRKVTVAADMTLATDVYSGCPGDPVDGTGSGDTGGSDTRAPDPTLAPDQVISLFGDSYTSVNVTNSNPPWDQATQVKVTDVLTYTNLNYQGYEYEAQDVSSKEFFHVDFYTEDSTALDMFVIKSGGAEKSYSLTDEIVPGQWVSVDIPLSAYGNVDLTAVNQLKVVGNGTVVLDNLYFHGSIEPAVPSAVTFSVNMTGVDLGGEVPTLQGTFNSWCGACNPMSDDDGDNVWTLTIDLGDADYEYKYAIGNWVSQEMVPVRCDNTIGANRLVTVNGDAALTTTLYNGCPGDYSSLYPDDDTDGGDVGGVLDFEDTVQAIYFADIGIAGDDAFPGSNSSAVMDVDDNTNTVIQSVRLASGKAWNSVLFVIGSDIDSPDETFPFAANDSVMSMDIRPGSVGKTVALKFEGPDGAAVITKATTTTSVADQWETLYFDFDAPIEGTSVSVGVEYFKVLVFYDFGGSPTADETFYFDNITYGGVTDPNAGGGSDPVQKNVTFSVDMTGVDLGGEVPTLQSTFNSWCGACNPMSDDDGDNVWTLTVPLDDGEYEYKYAIGNWVSQEDVPSTCENTIGANRKVTVAADMTLATDVYSGCPVDNGAGGADPVQKNVTFSVDMTGVDLGGEVPTLQSTFNSWCGACNPMSDDDGDNVWTLTVPLDDGEYEYKYAIGNWVSQEDVPSTCENTIGANRKVTVAADMTLATDVYSGCPVDNSSGGNNDSSAEGELVTNGGFESGDFSGWETYDGGLQAVVNTDKNGGTYSALLSSTNGGGDAVIKAANLASGSLTTGQTATISFDLKGSMTGAGGVVFAQFFHEKAEGGTSNGEGMLSGAPLALSSSWQSHSYTSVISGEVAGGVSLLLKAGCGGDACSVDAYFDNVSVTVK